MITKTKQRKPPLIRVYAYFRKKSDIVAIDRAAKQERRSRSEFIVEKVLRALGERS